MMTVGRRKRSVRLKEKKANLSKGVASPFFLDNRVRRENETAAKFHLSNFHWSPWQLAICAKKLGRKDLTRRQVRGHATGFKAQEIFGGKYEIPALYEAAVRIKPKAQNNVVYSKMCRGFKHSSWEKALLGNNIVQQQVNNVLSYGCDVYIRRAILGSSEDYASQRKAKSTYDYAWSDSRGTGKHRKVYKGDVPISLEFQENYDTLITLFTKWNE